MCNDDVIKCECVKLFILYTVILFSLDRILYIREGVFIVQLANACTLPRSADDSLVDIKVNSLVINKWKALGRKWRKTHPLLRRSTLVFIIHIFAINSSTYWIGKFRFKPWIWCIYSDSEFEWKRDWEKRSYAQSHVTEQHLWIKFHVQQSIQYYYCALAIFGLD